MPQKSVKIPDNIWIRLSAVLGVKNHNDMSEVILDSIRNGLPVVEKENLGEECKIEEVEA
jgi:hypothetical protein